MRDGREQKFIDSRNALNLNHREESEKKSEKTKTRIGGGSLGWGNNSSGKTKKNFPI